jgi:hypothetical protein
MTGDLNDEIRASAWPSDHLVEVEQCLVELWLTIDEDEDELVQMTDERDAILTAAHAAIAQALMATTGLMSPAPVAVFEGLAQLKKNLGYLRANLDQGVAVEDLIGPYGSDRYLEEDLEALGELLEVVERDAGRPPLTEDQALADIAKRLSWERRRVTKSGGRT